MEKKTCSKCKVEQDIEFFSLGSGYKHRNSWCRSCMREAGRKHQAKQPKLRPAKVRLKNKSELSEEAELFNKVNVRW